MPDVQKLLNTLGLRLNPAVGPDGKPQPIQMRGASSAHYSPSPQYFREQFKLQPNNSELWNNYGAYEATNHRLDSAFSAYETALELDSSNVHASRNLGSLIWNDRAQRQRAEDLFQVALRADDLNFRRETASLLASLVLESEGDGARVRSLHREATNGDPLVGPLANYGMYLLQYCPGEGAYSAQLLRLATQLDPKYPSAAAGMALLQWFEDGDLQGARSLIEPLCVEFHREYPLMAMAVKLAVADGDVPAAEAWLRRLARIVGRSDEVVETYHAYLALLRGESLASIEGRLHGLPGSENRINEAYLLWAQGKRGSASAVLDAVDHGRVAIDAQRELEIVRFLLDRADDSGEATSLALPRDQTLLKALSEHPELTDDRLARLVSVIGT